MGDVVGDVEKEDGVLVIRRIHVSYIFTPDAGFDEEAVLRVFEIHAPRCPVYKTLSGAIDITTELTIKRH